MGASRHVNNATSLLKHVHHLLYLPYTWLKVEIATKANSTNAHHRSRLTNRLRDPACLRVARLPVIDPDSLTGWLMQRDFWVEIAAAYEFYDLFLLLKSAGHRLLPSGFL